MASRVDDSPTITVRNTESGCFPQLQGCQWGLHCKSASGGLPRVPSFSQGQHPLLPPTFPGPTTPVALPQSHIFAQVIPYAKKPFLCVRGADASPPPEAWLHREACPDSHRSTPACPVPAWTSQGGRLLHPTRLGNSKEGVLNDSGDLVDKGSGP